jgi:hypothetical protein
MASISTNPKGSGQAIGASSAMAPEKARFFAVADLADILDVRGCQRLADFGFEIVAVEGVDLGCDLQRHPATFCDPDCPIDSLSRRDAPEKGKVRRPSRLRCQKALGQAVMNGPDPTGAGNGPPLHVGNRDHRDRGK